MEILIIQLMWNSQITETLPHKSHNNHLRTKNKMEDMDSAIVEAIFLMNEEKDG